jgi:hypothetical protein
MKTNAPGPIGGSLIHMTSRGSVVRTFKTQDVNGQWVQILKI